MRAGGICEGEYRRADAELSVCRIDCCTFIVEVQRRVLLFDPWLYDPATFAPLWGSCHEEPVVIQRLPQPDVLLISQNAPDHLDVRAVIGLSRETPVIAPGDAAKKLRKVGFHVHALDAGQSMTIHNLRISAVGCEHPGVLRQNGYFVESDKARVLVFADPALTPALVEAVDALPKPVDALLVGSTGFTLRGFGQIVMQPEEAAQIAARVRATHLVPTRTIAHERVWGVFGRFLVKSFVPPEQAFRRLADEVERIAPETVVLKLERGEGRTLRK